MVFFFLERCQDISDILTSGVPKLKVYPNHYLPIPNSTKLSWFKSFFTPFSQQTFTSFESRQKKLSKSGICSKLTIKTLERRQ